MKTTLALLLLLTASNTSAASLEGRIKRLVNQSPAAKHAYFGALIVDEKGRKLASINADRLFTPASNVKLFSTALALERLGPDKRFETRVEQRGSDLVLIGTGDANLSGRVIPYAPNTDPGPPLTVIDDLASQVVAQGIREIAGDIIGDDTAFLYEPYAPGWAIEDAVDGDGAPTSALVVNDNEIALKIFPGVTDGAPASISLNPPLPLFDVTNNVVTTAPAHIERERLPYSRTWRIWGTLPAGADPHTESRAIDDPALFAALALRYSLEQHGITVHGAARAVHRDAGLPFNPPPAGEVVARHQSPPLVEDLRVTDKVSQNLHADLLLSDVAGSRRAGLEELTRFLTAAGIPADAYRFYDGSGLSRQNLVSPEAIVTLLRYMANSPNREDWFSLLPISGVDGSLMKRLNGKRTQGRIRAKTGSIGHVSALSGYAQTRRERELTFSIMLNHSTAPISVQRELIDKVCELMLK